MSALRNMGIAGLVFCGMYVLPAAGYLAIAERAVATGHTDVTEEGRRNPTIQNYGVMARSRSIYITTGLFPCTLYEQDGKIMRRQVVMNRTLPVNFYFPATDGEIALYRNWFPT